MGRLTFGIKTVPQHVTYDEMLAIWREADSIESIEHAWLFDHFAPINSDVNGPCLEGWTALFAWARAEGSVPQLSPLAACWTSELGGLNKFVHTWVYKDLAERDRVRKASREGGRQWPPQAGVRPIRQENKLLIPAAFSPVR